MNIDNYISNFNSLIQSCPFVHSKEIIYDERYSEVLFVSGVITFIDISRLTVKEYILFSDNEYKFIKYAYNYIDAENKPVFRYDNASDPKAKFFESYPEHKHIASTDILPSKKPSIELVLNEISTCLISKQFKF